MPTRPIADRNALRLTCLGHRSKEIKLLSAVARSVVATVRCVAPRRHRCGATGFEGAALANQDGAYRQLQLHPLVLPQPSQT
jgi:hypothetical protein